MSGEIALYGATGYTGRLVARELERRGLSFTIAGRNSDKLVALNADLAKPVPAVAVDVNDSRRLQELLAGHAVVINCAGPFSQIGEQVVAAAVATGTHYLDTTGEQLYIHKLFRAYGERARRAGVTVLPAIGFDFLPGDLLAHLTAQGLGELTDMTIAYYVTDMQATHGTMLSAIEIMRSGKLAYENGYLRRTSGSFAAKQFDFGTGVGVVPFVDYPSGEILTVPRHVDTRRMTSLLSASAIAPEGVAPMLGAGTALAALVAKTPAVKLLRKAVQRLPEGPSESHRERAAFKILARATSRTTRREGLLAGHDVYGITAVICAEAAERMASPQFDRAGVLAPAEAFDASDFLQSLSPQWLTVSVDALDSDSVPVVV